MSIRTDVTVDFEVSPRIILVAAPSTSITLQDLVDTCRDLEDELLNLDNDHLVDAAGKEELGGGIQVGVTATLKDAKVSFEARSGPTYVQCQVSGGNIVALDSLGAQMSPILPTAFTQVVISQSTSATLIHNESASDMAAAVWASICEGTFTYEDTMRLVSAAMAGKLSGAPAGPVLIRDVSDTKDRITATVDSNGNRIGVIYDVSD